MAWTWFFKNIGVYIYTFQGKILLILRGKNHGYLIRVINGYTHHPDIFTHVLIGSFEMLSRLFF